MRMTASSRSERSGTGISALRSGRSCSSTSVLAFGGGLAGHVELHADLVELQRRELARHGARPTCGAARRCARRATRRAAPRSCTRGCTRGCACSCGSRRGARSRSRRLRRCGRGRSWRRRAPTCSRARGCRRSPRAGAARPSSLTFAMRARTSGSVMPSRSPSAAYGRASRGKSHCTALSSSRSTSSSSCWSALVVNVTSPRAWAGRPVRPMLARSGPAGESTSRRRGSSRSRHGERRCAASVARHGERARCPAAARASTGWPGRSWRTSAIDVVHRVDLVLVDGLDDVADVHAGAARPARRRRRR